MRTYTTGEAIREIEAAENGAAIFGSPSDPADRRAARGIFRSLALAVHPDRAQQAGGPAADAMARLNLMHDQWMRQARPGSAASSRPAPTTAGADDPYLEGRKGPIRLRQRVAADPDVATYATQGPTLFVDIARQDPGSNRVRAVVDVAGRLAGAGLGAFVPTVVDRGITQNCAWTAWQIPSSMVTLRQICDEYAEGLDGRDWAWMARRVLMVLAQSPLSLLRIGLDSIWIQPEEHGVVVTGWAQWGRPLGCGPCPAAPLAALFPLVLAPDERRQLRFAAGADRLDAFSFLREYDTLLAVLYGPRRFRPLRFPNPNR